MTHDHRLAAVADRRIHLVDGRLDAPPCHHVAAAPMRDLRRLSACVGLRPAAPGRGRAARRDRGGRRRSPCSGSPATSSARPRRQPPILSLTVAMVTVRALALVRPTARYGERLWSHDLAFRTLGHVRPTCSTRLEPLAPTGLEAFRRGELLSRMVADVDELQDLVLRVLLPAAVAVGAPGRSSSAAWCG